MVRINDPNLRKTLDYLLTLENILEKEIRQIRGNKFHLDKILPEHLVKTYSIKEQTALDFSKNLQQTSYEANVITLVSVFESIVFAKYKTTYGTIKSYVRTLNQKPLSYYKSREKFVNGSIDKLHAIMELIKGHVEEALFQDLERIKKQRDYIAHGKRFNDEAPEFDMTLEQIALILDAIIVEIER